MTLPDPNFEVRLATSEQDVLAAKRLRYRVFVSELGGDGALVDHAHGLEEDVFDAHCDHLILCDKRRDATSLDHVVGAYRLLPQSRSAAAGGFYSESEYDLTSLKSSGRRLLELGRSCLAPEYRGGTAMLALWSALADYIQTREIEVLFGVASFHGTDVQALAHPLSLLAARHLAPPALCVRTHDAHYQPMNILPEEAIDRKRAMVETPSLIKAYLRLGGFVGDGAFIDHAFNTVDVCLIMDVNRIAGRQRALYVPSVKEAQM